MVCINQATNSAGKLPAGNTGKMVSEKDLKGGWVTIIDSKGNKYDDKPLTFDALLSGNDMRIKIPQKEFLSRLQDLANKENKKVEVEFANGKKFTFIPNSTKSADANADILISAQAPKPITDQNKRSDIVQVSGENPPEVKPEGSTPIVMGAPVQKTLGGGVPGQDERKDFDLIGAVSNIWNKITENPLDKDINNGPLARKPLL